MGKEFSSSMVPSAASELLRSFIGKKVARLVRYSWWPANEVGSECGIEDKKAFSRTAGPLAVYFEGGGALGVASDPALNSIIVWDEGKRGAGYGAPPLDTDNELFAIYESGPFSDIYWRQFVGLALSEFVILKRVIMNPKEESRPSEVGLRFGFDGGASFIASHGLLDNSDDFVVLEANEADEIKLFEFSMS
ncbi:hypothetical protein [Ralstonia flaminis]|jgi:hypothetical protein|uniref:Bacteriophage protein n=1 Tax=Ralstonia flaminis TaxID=3058597 RepID=A0ABN9JY40_9RALS|nr:hypothetical protein [Ralstonia sp. LMG 18101]CAJ0822899.1 hypothetical protein LMG18101_05259 [Ralstonia sp. LMG 18101]